MAEEPLNVALLTVIPCPTNCDCTSCKGVNPMAAPSLTTSWANYPWVKRRIKQKTERKRFFILLRRQAFYLHNKVTKKNWRFTLSLTFCGI
jgi:hypothetical protein